jgi:hypothetical protein
MIAHPTGRLLHKTGVLSQQKNAGRPSDVDKRAVHVGAGAVLAVGPTRTAMARKWARLGALDTSSRLALIVQAVPQGWFLRSSMPTTGDPHDPDISVEIRSQPGLAR